MTLDYRLFGLKIRSALRLSMLAPGPEAGADPDVTIEAGGLAEALPQARLSAPLYEIDPGVILLRIPGVGRFLVEGGRRITVDAAPGVDAASLELYLLGSAMGALCQQRGLLPLHASAVQVGGACVAFTGHSGAGKSTMAASLAERGYPLVCDDVCVVSAGPGGDVLVSAADPRVKLWADGLDSMKIGVEGLRAVRSDVTKYHVPVSGVTGEEPIRLAAVYVLAERDGERCIEALHGFAAVMALAENTYRSEFIEPLGLSRQHFAHCGAIARAARVRRLTRPREFSGIGRTVADLERDWRDLGLATG